MAINSAEIFKSQGVHSREFRQSKQQYELLKVQKKRRNEPLNEHRSLDRSIEPLKMLFYKPDKNKK